MLKSISEDSLFEILEISWGTVCNFGLFKNFLSSKGWRPELCSDTSIFEWIERPYWYSLLGIQQKPRSSRSYSRKEWHGQIRAREDKNAPQDDVCEGNERNSWHKGPKDSRLFPIDMHSTIAVDGRWRGIIVCCDVPMIDWRDVTGRSKYTIQSRKTPSWRGDKSKQAINGRGKAERMAHFNVTPHFRSRRSHVWAYTCTLTMWSPQRWDIGRDWIIPRIRWAISEYMRLSENHQVGQTYMKDKMWLTEATPDQELGRDHDNDNPRIHNDVPCYRRKVLNDTVSPETLNDSEIDGNLNTTRGTCEDPRKNGRHKGKMGCPDIARVQRSWVARRPYDEENHQMYVLKIKNEQGDNSRGTTQLTTGPISSSQSNHVGE